VTVSVLGVRHHGPGSARSVLAELERLRPDAILIEGPPDANDLIDFARSPEMVPPVALLVYATDEPSEASFYPFAEFSPEWVAIRFGLANSIAVSFIDLSVGHRLAIGRAAGNGAADHIDAEAIVGPDRADPLGWLARAAGQSDGEQWWDRTVESRRASDDTFEAILEAMTALRSELGDDDPNNALREATMRTGIRAAEKAGAARVAVVCGAWHAPVLAEMPKQASDQQLLKALPKPVRTAAAWVPWTYERLASESGYGAGIDSPGWYEHLWTGAEPLAISWMGRVAQVFRAADMDASSAHLIEATRLADTLAALRGLSTPSLAELTEATRSVLCMGSDLPLALVRDKLIIGERLGEVPVDAPQVPLVADLEREQRRLRLRPEAGRKTIDLDLRTEMDLGRSHLLHRLSLLDVPWGKSERVSGKSGTFHEIWGLAWRPEFMVSLVVANRWGNTVEDAGSGRTIERAQGEEKLAALSDLIERALLADLPAAVEAVVNRIGDVAAVAGDVAALMGAVPPLARVLRYGNVRRTDTEAVAGVVDGLVARVCVGLGGGCASLDDEAAQAMAAAISAVDDAIALLDDPDKRESWRAALRSVSDQIGVHGVVAGRCVRLLVDARVVEVAEATLRMRLALSPGAEPMAGAAWVEGFLRDSGMILLHDPNLWQVLDGWIGEMAGDAFDTILPLLRRTISTFPAAERRAIGERAKGSAAPRVGLPGGFSEERAAAVLPVLARLLGLTEEVPQ
jgi:Family of unknown function (DUF5682)